MTTNPANGRLYHMLAALRAVTSSGGEVRDRKGANQRDKALREDELIAGWTELSNQQRNAFQRDGFLILRRVLTPQQVSTLAAAGDRLVGSERWERLGFQTGGEGRNAVAAEPEHFLPLMTHPVVLPIVAQLMGPRLQLHTSQHIWAPPQQVEHTPAEDPLKLGWHRDIAEMTQTMGLGVMPRVEIKAMFYFSDCDTPGHGQTWVARGSHMWQPDPVAVRPSSSGPQAAAAGQNEQRSSYSEQLRPRIVAEQRAVEPMLQAGDCLLFENRTFHSKGFNRSDRTRKTLVIGYSHRWMRPDDYSTQEPALLERYCNPLERELMTMHGMNRTASGAFKAGGEQTLLERIAARHGCVGASTV
eukprot:COSAG01_NODE_1492_length_10127_cov_55.322996_2_plen_358_part_00